MKKSHLLTAAACLLSVIALSRAAHADIATTITFDEASVPTGTLLNNSDFDVDGYHFDFSLADGATISGVGVGGTNAIEAQTGSGIKFKITRIDGSGFTLDGFDLNQAGGNGSFLFLTGQKLIPGGPSLSIGYDTPTGGYVPIVPIAVGSNFTSTLMTSATFDLTTNLTGDSIAIDNIQLTSTVPEPASLGLLGIGLLALTPSRRHRQAYSFVSDPLRNTNMEWRNMRSRSNQLWAVMAVVFVGCGLAHNAAEAATIVGPASLPVGIDNLSITYSGGTALFNVRFDERSFNDIYGSGTPALTFNTMADVTAAMTAVHAVLQPLPFPTFAGSTPTYDGQGNNSIYYPLVFDDTEVTFEYLLRLQPAQWVNAGLGDDTVARDAAFNNSDIRAWARFTPVPEPASAVLLALGGLALTFRGRRFARSS